MDGWMDGWMDACMLTDIEVNMDMYMYMYTDIKVNMDMYIYVCGYKVNMDGRGCG